MTSSPAASSASPNPVSTQATVTGKCAAGIDDLGTGMFYSMASILQGSGPGSGDEIAEAYQLTLTDNSTSATAEVTGFAVVFYSQGQELTSDTQNLSSPTFITPGQSLTWTEYPWGTSTSGQGASVGPFAGWSGRSSGQRGDVPIPPVVRPVTTFRSSRPAALATMAAGHGHPVSRDPRPYRPRLEQRLAPLATVCSWLGSPWPHGQKRSRSAWDRCGRTGRPHRIRRGFGSCVEPMGEVWQIADVSLGWSATVLAAVAGALGLGQIAGREGAAILALSAAGLIAGNQYLGSGARYDRNIRRRNAYEALARDARLEEAKAKEQRISDLDEVLHELLRRRVAIKDMDHQAVPAEALGRRDGPR